MIQLRVQVDDLDDLQFAQSWAGNEEGAGYEVVTEGDDGGLAIEPVTAVLIAAGVLALARFILDWFNDRKGGTVVDLRPGREDQVYRDKDLNYGWILVISADGQKVEINVKDAPKTATERLLGSVISGALKSASDIAEEAKAALGAEKVKAVAGA